MVCIHDNTTTHSHRSYPQSIPLVNTLTHGFIDWLIESFVRWLVAAILLRSCFGIDAIHPELRKGRRSAARDGGQLGGCLLSMYANSQQCFSCVQPKYIVALHGGKGRCCSAASHAEHAGPRIIDAHRERQHHRLIEPSFHGDGCGITGLGCYRDLEHVSVGLSQGETVFLSKHLALTRTSGPRFQRPLARRTTMLSVRTGQCGADSLYM